MRRVKGAVDDPHTAETVLGLCRTTAGRSLARAPPGGNASRGRSSKRLNGELHDANKMP